MSDESLRRELGGSSITHLVDWLSLCLLSILSLIDRNKLVQPVRLHIFQHTQAADALLGAGVTCRILDVVPNCSDRDEQLEWLIVRTTMDMVAVSPMGDPIAGDEDGDLQIVSVIKLAGL